MESRDIYNLTRRDIVFNAEWIHLGLDKEIKKELLKEKLEVYFDNYNTIMVKRGRLNSEEIHRDLLLEKVVELNGQEDFELWSSDFSRSIKFNKVGVMNLSIIIKSI